MTYSGVEVAYMDTSRMSGQERAMPEGEIAEIIASDGIDSDGAYGTADRVLAVLRPHLGLGVTDGLSSEEWYDLESAVVDAINGYEDDPETHGRYEALLATLRDQRAIARRGCQWTLTA